MQFGWPKDIDNWALFLDIDGTLVPIAPDPWSVKPAPTSDCPRKLRPSPRR